MTSGFIIEANCQLQPDPSEVTAALLRVIIYKMDNTSFGNDVPIIPQWNGPKQFIVQVQAILFTSLASSLFSAFLAMLGKQWLNRYESIDMRGSAIERSRNRQRKLDGIANWYFDHVMESLPLMLQAALLLQGLALSRYLWEINRTVGSVVLGATASGVLFFFCIVFAGATSITCPYQTPAAQVLRQVPKALRQIPRTLRRIPESVRRIPPVFGMLRSGFSAFVGGSTYYRTVSEPREAPSSLFKFVNVVFSILNLPLWLIMDACKAITWPLVFLFRRLEQGLEQEMLDVHCILWTLRISLDRVVRLSTLKYLATTTLVDFDPTLVVDCFKIFFSCVKAIDDKVVIAQGTEELAAESSICCLQTLSHLIAIDPTSRVPEDIQRKYTRAFPLETSFDSLPLSHTLRIIHMIFNRLWREKRQQVRWEEDYNPSITEHVVVAGALTRIAWFEYQRRGRVKVPRWILRFALRSLSQSPPPPTSVVADSLSIVAINLGCHPWNTAAPGERCVCI